MAVRRTVLQLALNLGGPGPAAGLLDVGYFFSYDDRISNVTSGARDVRVPFDCSMAEIRGLVVADFIAFVAANTAPAGSGVFTDPNIIRADEIVFLEPGLGVGTAR